MSVRLGDVSLTPEGISFLERDRLPGRSKQTTVKHIYLPLPKSLKPSKGAHGFKDSIPFPRVSSNALMPADSSAQVRSALLNEKHAWKSANTEIHAVESTVTGTLWEHQQIEVTIDQSGALTASGASQWNFRNGSSWRIQSYSGMKLLIRSLTRHRLLIERNLMIRFCGLLILLLQLTNLAMTQCPDSGRRNVPLS